MIKYKQEVRQSLSLYIYYSHDIPGIKCVVTDNALVLITAVVFDFGIGMKEESHS